jgi:hypothetical protein
MLTDLYSPVIGFELKEVYEFTVFDSLLEKTGDQCSSSGRTGFEKDNLKLEYEKSIYTILL